MDTAHQDLVKDRTPANALPEQQKAIDALDVAQKKPTAKSPSCSRDEEAKKLKEASAAVGKLITRQQQVEISTAIVSARVRQARRRSRRRRCRLTMTLPASRGN